MLSGRSYRKTKRVFDIIFSLIILCLFLVWLIPLLALIIWLGTRGNPIFIQDRVGRDKKVFRCYKLRTMRINPTPERQAEVDDRRVTRFGKILRYSGLDELPQFLNVLLGQMSVVGPRPHMVVHDHEFGKLIPEYRTRHSVKPGMTGLAQIKGCRGQINNISDLEARLRYDIEYIERMNLGLDLNIIGRSLIDMVIGAKNAY
jgi:putative colanic acid biosynthesis UDP-glucose lipid carrier transferase